MVDQKKKTKLRTFNFLMKNQTHKINENIIEKNFNEFAAFIFQSIHKQKPSFKQNKTSKLL